MTTTNSNAARKAAEEMYDAMVWEDRSSGEKWFLRDNSPNWMTEAMYAASESGCSSSLDVLYENAHIALGAIWDAWQDGSDEDELEEIVLDKIEPDIYTTNLLSWLAADLSHLELCEEVGQQFGWEFGKAGGLAELFMLGQAEQRKDVAITLLRVFASRGETQ